MSQFIVGEKAAVHDEDTVRQLENDKRALLDSEFDTFLDPAVDQHSAFYVAMERDKHAAHLVSGTSFLDLNNVILKTECNNVYESMNENDMQKLRTLMWDVYVPHMKERLRSQINPGRAMDDFQAQMYVVHLSVRVAQAMQLVFELNQKKSFSAAAKTAYEVALQDVLYHPTLKRKVHAMQFTKLINYLRRHPQYSTAFNTYVGYKLLRQQLVRGGSAGTNRKSNDAERLHDEAANRLWSVLEEHPNVYDDFMQSSEPYTMEWHHLYYKEVANTLYHKLADEKNTNSSVPYSKMDNDQRHERRDAFNKKLQGEPDPSTGMGPARATGDMPLDTDARIRPTMDIASAIEETRATVSYGTAKRTSTGVTQETICPANRGFTTATVASGSVGDNRTGASGSVGDVNGNSQVGSKRPHSSTTEAAKKANSTHIVDDNNTEMPSGRMRNAYASLLSMSVFGAEE
jgi:hypothetical protein